MTNPRYPWPRQYFVSESDKDAANAAIKDWREDLFVQECCEDVQDESEEQSVKRVVSMAHTDGGMSKEMANIIEASLNKAGISFSRYEYEKIDDALGEENVELPGRHAFGLGLVVRAADAVAVQAWFTTNGYADLADGSKWARLILVSDPDGQAPRAYGRRITMSERKVAKIVTFADAFPGGSSEASRNQLFMFLKNSQSSKLQQLIDNYDVTRYRVGGSSARIRVRAAKYTNAQVLNTLNLRVKP